MRIEPDFLIGLHYCTGATNRCHVSLTEDHQILLCVVSDGSKKLKADLTAV